MPIHFAEMARKRGPKPGSRKSASTRAKMSAAKLGCRLSEGHREAISRGKRRADARRVPAQLLLKYREHPEAVEWIKANPAALSQPEDEPVAPDTP